MPVIRLLAVFLAVVVLFPENAAARSHSGRHFRPRTVVFVGGYYGPYWHPYPWYHPGPYYYGPDYVARSTPPTVYIEKFDGTPDENTSDLILCPSSDTPWPQAKECPGGWARVVTGPQSAPPAQ